jgi:hypothetical protein
MGWFSKAIDRGVKEGVETAIKSYLVPGGPFDAVVERVVWEQMEATLPRDKRLTVTGFVWALRIVFRKRGGLSYAEASRYANDTLKQYLADEKVKYGDRDYAWTRDAAEEIAEEYEFRHWEAA